MRKFRSKLTNKMIAINFNNRKYTTCTNYIIKSSQLKRLTKYLEEQFIYLQELTNEIDISKLKEITFNVEPLMVLVEDRPNIRLKHNTTVYRKDNNRVYGDSLIVVNDNDFKKVYNYM